MQEIISLSSREPIEFVNITERVCQVVTRSQRREGLVVVTSQHTTAAVILNEECSELQKDMVRFLKEWIPARRGYLHDRAPLDGWPNTHSHLLSLALPQQVTLSLHQGELQLGRWQKIFFVELDGPRAERRLVVSIFGGDS